MYGILMFSLMIAIIVPHAVVQQPIVISSKEISVDIGRSVEINTNDLTIIRFNNSDPCKVVVSTIEPLFQRVGSFLPAVFDCSFRRGSLIYEHSGSPLLKQDFVKMRVYLFTLNEIVEESLILVLNVQNAPYTFVSVLKALTVETFYDTSDPIDGTLMQLKTTTGMGNCRARISQSQNKWPAYGQLIYGSNQTVVDVLKLDCKSFLNSDLKYKHLKPPSPDCDFVVVEFEDVSGSISIRERVFIKVEIKPAFPNLQPQTSSFGSLLLEVSDFVLYPLTSDVLFVRDEETPAGNLIINVTHLKPAYGYFVHLSNRNLPVYSFRQFDIDNRDIAFQPPKQNQHGKIETYEINLIVLDAEYLPSDPITLHISVKQSFGQVLRAVVLKSLILLEGHHAVVDSSYIEATEMRSSPLQIAVQGGLKHGQLKIRNATVMTFTIEQLKNGVVVYKHDDSESDRDIIELRISNRDCFVLCTLPIVILPVDDEPPDLVINKEVSVKMGRKVKISSNFLKAVDKDTNNDELTYIITEYPKMGQIFKRFFSRNSLFEPVNNFTQRDLNSENMYYFNTGQKAGMDVFEFFVEDSNNAPNPSPTYKFNIRVRSSEGKLNSSKPKHRNWSLSVPENQVGYFNLDCLNYSCLFCHPKDIVYTIITAPYYVNATTIRDRGKLVLADSALSLEVNRALPEVNRFTQEHVNYGKIGYIPPKEDIGMLPLFVRFSFSVCLSKNLGKYKLTKNENFNIIILPVNDQPPLLDTSRLSIEEGSSVILSRSDISIQDTDTSISDLYLNVSALPRHGVLTKDGQKVQNGDEITLEEIEKDQIKYNHDGSETSEDEIVFGLSDGSHFVTAPLNINIIPVNDELPIWTEKLDKTFEVFERGRFTLTEKNLKAFDMDTPDNDLIFIVSTEPTQGWFTEHNKRISRFSQKNVRLRNVDYVHNGQEIGPFPVKDEVYFVVNDGRVDVNLVIQLHVVIVILPVDNRPPKISILKVLNVGEGQSAVFSDEFINVVDYDTLMKNVRINIIKQPFFGYIVKQEIGELVNNSRESERINREFPLESFYADELNNKQIVYIQVNHSGFEPEYDQIQLLATDVSQNSTIKSFRVNIIPMPDEPPRPVINEIIVVKKGKMAIINSDKFSVTDQDFPPENILISVASPPSFGELLKVQHSDTVQNTIFASFEGRLPIETFNARVFYKHDDSGNVRDTFSLTIDDGVFNVIETLYVKIESNEDISPGLV